MDTLILNFFYRPVACANWKKSFVLVYLERAEILEEYEDRVISSAKKTFKMPSVIRITRKHKNRKNRINYSKNMVYLRDGGKCQYCGKFLLKSEATIDHVVPKVLGGKTTFLNTVVACSPCNTKKGSQTLTQAGKKLLTTPVEPKYIDELFRLKLKDSKDLPKGWKQWIY